MTQSKSGINFAVIILFSLLISSGFISAITGSIGNAKMVLSDNLYPQLSHVDQKISIEKSILVRNSNDIPINITLQPDENAKEFIEIINSSFILQPGKDEKAYFNVKISKDGKYEGKINVFFNSMEGNETGVVLSSAITVIAGDGENSEDNEQENNDDTQTDDSTSLNSVTGNAANIPENGEGPNLGVILVIITSLLLIVVLFFLMIMMSRKKSSTEIESNETEEIKKAVSNSETKKRAKKK